jgi:hypothetical protein
MAEPVIDISILTRVHAQKDLQVEIVKKTSTIANSHPAKMEVTVLMASMASPVFVSLHLREEPVRMKWTLAALIHATTTLHVPHPQIIEISFAHVLSGLLEDFVMKTSMNVRRITLAATEELVSTPKEGILANAAMDMKDEIV